MAGERRYTRIPPESTGDRVYMVFTAEVRYDAKDTNHVWQIGKHYNLTGSIDSNNDFSIHVHGVVEETSTTGVLAVHYQKLAKHQGYSPENDANIQYGGVTIATVNGTPVDVYIPGQNIVGYDNPEYGLDIDITGSANMRFAEGLPQLDAWGKLRISGATQIGDYIFSQEEILTNNFSPTKLNGGYVDFQSLRKSIRVGIDSAASDFTATTGFAACSSNTYHHYVPGSSHLYMGTARINDPTAANISRSWGLFDATNGFMFNVSSGGTLNVIIRSSTTGTKVENIIPSTSWNGDKLDGLGDSQTVVDLANNNIWWIDIQWHGAGRVRFGTYIDGQRVLCHSYYHGNNYDTAMTQTASLPTCYSIGATGAGISSNLFIESWSSSVWTESTIDLSEKGSPATYATTHHTVTANVSDPWQYLVSLSPEVLLPDGDVNHSLYQPTSISAYAFDSAALNGVDAIIDLKAELASVHSGHDFTLISGTTVEQSTAGTSYEAGKVVLNEMFKGRYETDLTDTYNNFQYGALKNSADDGGTIINNVKSISQASPAVITVKDGEVLLLRETSSQGDPAFPKNISEYNGRYEFYSLGGMTEAHSQYLYVKPLSSTTAALYTDEALTTPFDTTGYTAHDLNTGYIKGFKGSRLVWSFFAKTRTALHTTVKLMITVNWKVVIQ